MDEQAPVCIKVENANYSQRSKKFIDISTTLKLEEERLNTFIDWPVSWLPPADLARDGFYYLRERDHCACLFCAGIIGDWEEGDTPRGEHRKHFPRCPFINGDVVGNIPLEQGQIIWKLSLNAEDRGRYTPPEKIPEPHESKERTGIEELDRPRNGSSCVFCSGIVSYLEEGDTPRGEHRKHCPFFDGNEVENNPLEQSQIMVRYTPLEQGRIIWRSRNQSRDGSPKWRDYSTLERRLASFFRMPERVKQKPSDLAEAGFFYCGLSDHVRCFHCGGGLRNWESEDLPWKEHGRWYPECTFVLLEKGREFVHEVRRERPPFGYSTFLKSTPKLTPSEKELETLLELDVIKSVLLMGFPKNVVTAAMRRKLDQTGFPFFSQDECITASLNLSEEKARQKKTTRRQQG